MDSVVILEGILTVLVVVLAFFTLCDFPERANFLTEEERAFVVYRLKYQGQKKSDANEVKVAQDDSFQWNIWVYWGIAAPLCGISLFLPTIIRSLGYTSSTAQLLTVPIYITASLLAVDRSLFILVCLGIIAVGFIMCIATLMPEVVYAAFSGNLTWLSNTAASDFYRLEDAPRYVLGHALKAAFIIEGIFAGLVFVFNYRRINVSREQQMAKGAHNGHKPKELAALGDRAITFHYVV
ncbi:hypothetical protein CC80DRAFT_515491 [Byssothecium circinans]|uniref:MFS general substrate transporter n=1 Tax=Byssothecium circinans TaxID=147558 RepID=A0A6A5TZM3_9PLEO|nr:hypothetical protein CC80DRAFT_515491 [Byssothecium circinans]